MKRTSKIAVAFLLIVSLVTVMVVPALAAGTLTTVDYVAFGDSVAAGVRGGVKETASDYGYTDLLAADLRSAGVLGSFSEDFCTSGMTAARLAESTAVLNDTSSTGYQLVKNAEVATLTIGGNDLLAPLYAYIKTLSSGQMPDTATIKQLLGTVASSVSDGTTAQTVETNIETVLQNILNANPSVKIYVMGYYNPLPVAALLTGVDLDTPLATFNTYIKKAVSDVSAKNSGASITYVETMAVVGADSSNNLVMTDIHPTEAGYKVIANEFWKQISPLLASASASASPTKAAVLVNGKNVAFEAYNIDGSNYFKLRDIAMALGGSAKQFGVSWDEAKKSIALSSGTAYTAVGGELTTSGNTATVDATRSAVSVYLDGKLLSLTAYNIGGFNYIKLRDVGAAINFGIGWNAATSTITIDTSAGYTA